MSARLISVFAHAWRVRTPRPAIFAILDTLAVGPLRRIWLKEVPWYVGRYVERRGNRVRLDGFWLDVSPDIFSTFQRGCVWLCRHEEPERLAIARFLDPTLPVIELGASTGALSCLINRRLRAPKMHVAVELNPSLIPVIERNRALNRCQFTVVHAAVGDPESTVTFAAGDDHLAGHAATKAGNATSLTIVTLQDLLNRFPGQRVTVVCDIEGMEVDVWTRSRDLFATRVDWFIVEVHEDLAGADEIRRMTRELLERGFEQVWERGWTRVFRNVRAVSTRAIHSGAGGTRVRDRE